MDNAQESTSTAYVQSATDEGIIIGIELGLTLFCIIMTIAMIAYTNKIIRVVGFMISFIVALCVLGGSIYFLSNKF